MRDNTVHITTSDVALVAPCGINCGLCRAYIRNNNPCPGCRSIDRQKLASRIHCKIKTCRHRTRGKRKYCFSCNTLPCADFLRLDKRYREKYGVDLPANLDFIKSNGIKRFVAREKIEWRCSSCGTLLCMHQPQCVQCGHQWRT